MNYHPFNYSSGYANCIDIQKKMAKSKQAAKKKAAKKPSTKKNKPCVKNFAGKEYKR